MGYLIACDACGESRGSDIAWDTPHCASCAAKRRHAAELLMRLHPALDRVTAILRCMRRVVTVGASSCRPADIAELHALLAHTERQLEADVDEWSLLVLRLDAAGNSTLRPRKLAARRASDNAIASHDYGDLRHRGPLGGRSV